MIELCYGDPGSVPAERKREAVEEVARRSALPHADNAFTASLRGLVGTYLERGPRNQWLEAETVQAPTLLVWGTDDRLVDVALAPPGLGSLPELPADGAAGGGARRPAGAAGDGGPGFPRPA